MRLFSLSARGTPRVLVAALAFAAGIAAAGEIHVLLGVDPADATGDVLLSASLAPASKFDTDNSAPSLCTCSR